MTSEIIPVIIEFCTVFGLKCSHIIKEKQMLMSFSGKKFRRTGGSNLEEFLQASNATEQAKRLLETNAPVWCFTLLDENTLSFHLQMDDFNMHKTFKLNEEFEMERLNGGKIRVTFSMEGDNVLKQIIKQPDGKIAYFTREFGPNNATLTLTMEGSDVRKAYIFYEMIE